MPDIRLECVNRDGSSVAPLHNAVLDAVTWELNGPGSIEFSMSQTDPAVKSLIANGNETQLWIDDVLMHWGINYKVLNTPTTAKFSCPGLLQYFNHRFVTNTSLDYTSIDQLQIGADLISAMQSGPGQDFNIRVGSFVPSGVVRSRRYDRDQHANALELLQQFPQLADALGKETGFDFDIVVTADGGRFWTPYYPAKGQHLTEPVLEWGRNITDFSVAEDGSSMANRVYITGGSNGDIKFEGNYRDDASADSALGEWQAIESIPQENDVAVLAERARSEVEKRRTPPVLPEVTAIETPEALLGVVHTGDWVQVEIDCGRVQVAEPFRVQSLTWKPGPGNIKMEFAKS